MLDVAKLLTDVFQIRVLGVKLGLKSTQVDSILENNKYDINEAAYKVLQKWLQGESERGIAYANLIQALHDTKLSMIVSDVFQNKNTGTGGVCTF